MLAIVSQYIFTNYCIANDFASIKNNEANVRAGPNIKYPVLWVFVKKNEPVEIIASFDQWRKIRDVDGDEGWIHKSMISNKKFSIINTNKTQAIYQEPKEDSKIIANVQPKVRVALKECADNWCLVNIQDINGWIRREKLWGE